jgi:hypothetical protein
MALSPRPSSLLHRCVWGVFTLQPCGLGASGGSFLRVLPMSEVGGVSQTGSAPGPGPRPGSSRGLGTAGLLGLCGFALSLWAVVLQPLNLLVPCPARGLCLPPAVPCLAQCPAPAVGGGAAVFPVTIRLYDMTAKWASLMWQGTCWPCDLRGSPCS